jgi:NAD(P)H-hydrate repair Nnr-like enzyme with NAD(P)H-hydrate dehydratase domain
MVKKQNKKSMVNLIRTNDLKKVRDFFKKFNLPKENSHKGQNGKVLIIGGSSLFHAASLWAAEVASHFVDIVHYCSTKENQKIFLNLKTKFRNGIIVSKKDLIDYVKEDDAILVGPGMIRKDKSNIKNQISKIHLKNQKDLIDIKDEGLYTYFLPKFLIENFSQKKFVFDAGALQMMDKEWLLKLKTQAVLTPHQKEFERLFGEKIFDLDFEKKVELVKKYAKKYKIIILLKAIKDIVSDGEKTYVVEGGNQGLTKGGSGDVLAGLVVSFYAKNKALESAVFASILLKKTADVLFLEKGYWYNINNLIETVPLVLKKIII